MSSTTASPVNPEQSQILSNRPLLSPPPGVTPNFTDPPNHGKYEIVVTSLLLCMTVTFVLNRVYMKTFIVRKYTWDDLTIFVATTGTVAYYAAGVIGIQKGRMGVHDWDISIAQAGKRQFLIPGYLISILPPPTYLFLKLTFFIMYRQIFGPMRWMRISAGLGAVLTTLFYISMTVCALIFTTPRRSETWFNHANTPIEQLNVKLSIPQSCVNLVLDLYILILPIMAVTKLHMTPRRKIGIILIFMTGLLACLGSILSIYYRVQLERTRDEAWAIIPTMTTTLLEMFVGIMCACMPAAAHTYHHHSPSYDSFKKIIRSHYGSLGLKNHETSPSFPETSSYDVKTSRGIHEGYVSLDAPEHPISKPVKSLQTLIRSGGPGSLEHDGIHLTYEMQQTSASQTPQDRGWAAV